MPCDLAFQTRDQGNRKESLCARCGFSSSGWGTFRLTPLTAPRLVGIGRWFGWLGVEALTKIRLKAHRHRGQCVRISGIDLVAGRARCASAAATAGPFTQERPIQMVFADPPRVVAPRAVPLRLSPSCNTNVGAVNAFLRAGLQGPQLPRPGAGACLTVLRRVSSSAFS